MHETLLNTLEARFGAHMHRHKDLEWGNVRARLDEHPDKLATLKAMEESGGEPDVIGVDDETGEFLFVDCAAESPKGRRSLCYDREALEARKKHKPDGSAMERAAKMGAMLLSEDEYRRLQALEPVDTKSSSWLLTPPEVRERGGAVFGDHRYGRTWFYHNGAESYYAARGFRCMLRV